jgi:hypothetical protein
MGRLGRRLLVVTAPAAWSSSVRHAASISVRPADELAARLSDAWGRACKSEIGIAGASIRDGAAGGAMTGLGVNFARLKMLIALCGDAGMRSRTTTNNHNP